SRPFRPLSGPEEPEIEGGAILRLEIIDPVIATGAQSAAEREPASEVQPARPLIDLDFIEPTRAFAKLRQAFRGQERDVRGGVMATNRRHGRQGQDEVTKGGKAYNKDALLGSYRGLPVGGPGLTARHRLAIFEPRSIDWSRRPLARTFEIVGT